MTCKSADFPNHIHVRPCGPTGQDDECACGCNAYGVACEITPDPTNVDDYIEHLRDIVISRHWEYGTFGYPCPNRPS